MEFMEKYTKIESVVEILDTEFAPHKYVFSNAGGQAKSRFEAAANGRSGSFIRVMETADRQGPSVWVNASKVSKFKVSKLDVPERIAALIDELATSEDEGRITEINDTLRFYFREA